MFAIDGVKLPSNASKEKSGTRADFLRQAERMEKAATKIIGKHQQADASNTDEAEQPNVKRNNWNACNAKPSSYVTRWQTTPKTAKAPKAVSACPTAPTTNLQNGDQ